MKQHLTDTDLKTLSPKARKRLEAWTIKHGYGTRNPIYGYQFEPYEDGTMWVADMYLSLGQLIEFLVDRWNDEDDDETYDRSLFRCADGCWRLHKDNVLLTIEYDELCDALWEAVKEVLDTKPPRRTRCKHLELLASTLREGISCADCGKRIKEGA